MNINTKTNTKTNGVPLIRSDGGVLVIGGVSVVGDISDVDDLTLVVGVPVVVAVSLSLMVSLLCSATAGASPIGVIPTAGSVVDPHCCQCGCVPACKINRIRIQFRIWVRIQRFDVQKF